MPERRWLRRKVLLVQIGATLVLLGSPLGNAAKLAALLAIWTLSFWPIRPAEAALFLASSTVFTVLNALTLRRGLFRFENPDWFGMPAFELVMWGFYVLHTLRMFAGRPAGPPTWLAGALAAVYAALFALIVDPTVLFLTSASLLALALATHHRPLDFGYVGYMVILGALVEYVGTGTGQWTYPDQPAGGVPAWFLTMWGGVGFFLGRLVAPAAGWLDRWPPPHELRRPA